MTRQDKHYIFYVDNGKRRLYLKKNNGKIRWDAIFCDAEKYKHYRIGISEATKIKPPPGFNLGYVLTETLQSFNKVL